MLVCTSVPEFDQGKIEEDGTLRNTLCVGPQGSMKRQWLQQSKMEAI
jgi:hypothetical protein